MLPEGYSATDKRYVIRSASDISRLVNHYNNNGSHASIIITIVLYGVFLDAYALGALAFGIRDVARAFNLTPAGRGIVASAITFGAIVGMFLSGYLTDKIDRYRILWRICCVYAGGASLCFRPNE